MRYCTTRTLSTNCPNTSPTVFESFGLPNETAILRASGVINLVQLFASMPVIFTLDLLGRRLLLLIGSVLSSMVVLI